MFERDAGLKNAEMTASIEGRSMKKTISELRAQICAKETEITSLQRQLQGLMSEKEKLSIDLMSRKEVWLKNEASMTAEIKELLAKLEQKTIVESQCRAGLKLVVIW